MSASARAGSGDRPPVTRIDIGQQETVITAGSGAAHPDALFVHRLGVGSLRVGRGPLLGEPPNPLQLEQAIAEVEDEVMTLARQLTDGGSLVAAGDCVARLASLGLAALPDPDDAQDCTARVLGLDHVERLCQRVVEVSEGSPVARSGVPLDGAFVATLLILREFMHHLGYPSVTVVTDARNSGAREAAADG